MTGHVPFTIIVIALHASPKAMLRLFRCLGLNPEKVKTEEMHWGHVRRSDEDIGLVFGPAGLKRVRATRLVTQLTDAGFRNVCNTLIVKPAVYTKTEERRNRHDPRGSLVREGRHKWGDDGKPAYKMYLDSSFALDHELELTPTAVLLDALLSHTVWERGRVLVTEDEPGSRMAFVEVVQPRSRPSRRVMELSFHPERGFESHAIDSP